MSTGGEVHTLRAGWACGLTDRGMVRSRNEDNYLIDDDLGLMVVADGMGGHAGGDIASAEALRDLQSRLREQVLPKVQQDEQPDNPDSDDTNPDGTLPVLWALYQAIEDVNSHVFELNRQNGSEPATGMGTTLVGLWCVSEQGPLIAFHVGDSRLYRLRAGVLAQLTRDHSLYQTALDAGALDNLPKRNILLQAIGPNAEVSPDVQPLEMQPGDVYLLCSDGVHGPLELADLERALNLSIPQGPVATCHALLQLAFSHGSTDNATVVLVGLGDPPAPA